MKSYLSILVFALLLTSCASKRGAVLRNPNDRADGYKGTVNTNRTIKSTSVSGLAYIDQYKGIAIREMNQYGIPASIKLAQALLESGNGNSYLAREANNHFGIKCGGVWNGKSITRDDDNPNDCFRVYGNPEESFKDHSQFLLRKRYEKLFTLDKDDYKGWARGLKEAGYATNPRYPELLIDLIERYQLQQYDRTETFVEKEKREEKVVEMIEVKTESEPPIQTEKMKSPVAMVIHEVRSSETLYSLSKRYNVSVEQIKQLNAMGSDNLSVGQLLVISK
ncbi:glucosaminidase domain-containing protein [Sphingobacterium lumbrici]|uniref:glucosaminidase domain-containing protein n=1 Tax=Sphingobacterium lumbrici TaxID=2559600 RepID=UPI00112871DE|nr:glucosaminidase domain-containing protein [Sphingobacterium lumbrici]